MLIKFFAQTTNIYVKKEIIFNPHSDPLPETAFLMGGSFKACQ